jgi:hypothetical protein
VGIWQVPESILIRLANTIGTARKMALLQGAPDCNQETSRYMSIMPYLISIYKNDFVKDILRKSCLSLSSWSPAISALLSKRSRSLIRSERSDANRFLNRNRCIFAPKTFATSLPASC